MSRDETGKVKGDAQGHRDGLRNLSRTKTSSQGACGGWNTVPIFAMSCALLKEDMPFSSHKSSVPRQVMNLEDYNHAVGMPFQNSSA